MSNALKLKLGLYLALGILAVWFFHQFHRSFSSNTQAAAERNSVLPGDVPSNATQPPVQVSSNAAAAKPNTNGVENAATNAASGATNRPEGPASTNAPAVPTNDTLIPLVATNEPAATNEPPATNAESAVPPPVVNAPLPHSSPAMIGYLGAFVGTMILLGLLIASDVSQFLGSRSVGFLFNDEGEGMRNPEYEEAESVWANGEHMEAIRLMRLYLGRNPREQYVALRIAEIYEKDLRNYLAAALEYEEVLKKKIEPERWGWAAIHLCNLYSKMGRTDQAVELLRRIESEYGETAAAEKARKRLAIFDSGGEQGLQPEEPAPPREY